MKKALVLGGGGFIGSHLSKRLKEEGYWVRSVDIKEKPDFFDATEICNEYMSIDLRDAKKASLAFLAPDQSSLEEYSFDEVYQLAADMGGAGYIFTGDNDYDVMSNSAAININVCNLAIKFNVKRIFYSSSACIYPKHNQIDPNNPNCEESSAYPAHPDSEYGWEKLFSERLYFSAMRNKGLDVRVARYHNVYGPYSSWNNGKEKAPAAICRKVIENDTEIEIWGNGSQTRSFLYIEDALDATIKLLRQDKFKEVVNIGSEEMVSINQLVDYTCEIANKKLIKNHIKGPIGVMGRNSDNKLIESTIGWKPKYTLKEGLAETYRWIQSKN
jgi:GDP-D-mannose 3',5'-epimerase